MFCLPVIDILFISDILQTFRIWFERIGMTQRKLFSPGFKGRGNFSVNRSAMVVLNMQTTMSAKVVVSVLSEVVAELFLCQANGPKAVSNVAPKRLAATD